jgi:hypothetical protein
MVDGGNTIAHFVRSQDANGDYLHTAIRYDWTHTDLVTKVVWNTGI